MSKRVDQAFDHLQQQASSVGLPTTGHFDKHVRGRILESVRDIKAVSHSKRRSALWYTTWAASAALILGMAGAYAWVTTLTKIPPATPAQHDTATKIPTYPVFTPPKNMHIKYNFSAPTGNLKVVSYTETPNYTQGPPRSDETYLIATIDGVERMLYQMATPHEDGAAIAKPSFWYTAGDATYVVMESNYFMSPHSVLALSIVKLTPRDGTWLMQKVVDGNTQRGIPYGTLANVNGRLLTYSMAIGASISPTWYEFTETGVHTSTVTDKWPDVSLMPHTYVYAFTVTTSSGTTSTVRGSLAPIRLHVGDTLAVEEHGDQKPVIAVVDATDPMHMTDSLKTQDSWQWVPSPYTQTSVYQMVKPFKGTLLLSVQTDATTNETAGNLSVPVIVSP